MEHDPFDSGDNASRPSSSRRDDFGDAVYQARPAGPVAAPPVIAPVQYPDSKLSRGSSVVDIFVAVSLFVCAFASPQFAKVVDKLEKDFPQFGILWSNVVIGIVTIAIVGLILLCRRQGPATIGLGRFRKSTFVGAAVAVPGCYAVMFGTGFLYLLIVQLFSPNGMDAVLQDKESLIDVIPQFSVATMLLFGVLTGFHEELLFRGLLLSRFNAILRNRSLAVIICAAFFGLMHAYQGPMGVIQTAAIGLVLGTIATVTRSLWPAIIGHAVFNSLQLAVLPLAKDVLEATQHHLTTMPVH